MNTTCVLKGSDQLLDELQRAKNFKRHAFMVQVDDDPFAYLSFQAGPGCSTIPKKHDMVMAKQQLQQAKSKELLIKRLQQRLAQKPKAVKNS